MAYVVKWNLEGSFDDLIATYHDHRDAGANHWASQHIGPMMLVVWDATESSVPGNHDEQEL